MLLFAVEWVQNKKENPSFSLWEQHWYSIGVICFIIKATSLFILIMESAKSFF